MEKDSNTTTLASSVLILVRAIDSCGYSSTDLLEKAGLDPSRLKDPLARYPYHSVNELWSLASKTIPDPCFCLKVATHWHPTSYGALGYSWLASSSLEDAFMRSSRFTRIVNTSAKDIMEYVQSDSEYGIVIHNDRIKPGPVEPAVDFSVAMILVMCRAAYGPHLKPIRVSFQHKKPKNTDCFENFFNAPVEFSRTHNAVWLDPVAVTTPLATANPDYLAHLDRNDLPMQVQAKLIERLPSGQVTEEMIASEINVSQRSLQRKLKQQGISFTQLLEDTRRDLGLLYVRDPNRSFNEIAYLLGFSEPGNFTRAFKRWYGSSPSQYRDTARH